MRVIIYGAGIAGLTLASRLGSAGREVLLVEPAQQLPDEGYMLELLGIGFDAAERMGLVPRLREIEYRIPRLRWIDRARKPIAQLDYRRIEHHLKGRLITLMRGELEQVLCGTLSRNVEVRFGHSIQEISFPGDSVEVTFSSGARERADLLVGADGPHSRVRQLILGDSAEAYRFLGFHAAAFVIDDPAFRSALDEGFTLMALPRRQTAFCPLRGAEVAAFFVHRMASTALPVSPVEQLNRFYREFGWVVPAALEHAASATNLYYANVGQIELARWNYGRVTFVGDACQSVSLLAGQGASLAMGGAVVLAEELLRMDSLEDALERYEQRMRPLIDREQLAGRRTAHWLVPATQGELFLRNTALRLASYRGMSWLLNPLLGQSTSPHFRMQQT